MALLTQLLFGKKDSDDTEDKPEERVEEPNLYELIERIIIEKQQMKEQIERLKKEVELLKQNQKSNEKIS